MSLPSYFLALASWRLLLRRRVVLTWDWVVGEDCAAASTCEAILLLRRGDGVEWRRGEAVPVAAYTYTRVPGNSCRGLWTGLCGVLKNAVGLPLGLRVTLQIDP
mmetsp:Transcript_15135/g.39984  ORF Transcript_15135/g.39984 Transcript_15135/m.39984 type:complete len:104 (+) Transcript_15135:300-611(+)